MLLVQAIDRAEARMKEMSAKGLHGEAMEYLQVKNWLKELLEYRIKSGRYMKSGALMDVDEDKIEGDVV